MNNGCHPFSSGGYNVVIFATKRGKAILPLVLFYWRVNMKSIDINATAVVRWRLLPPPRSIVGPL